MYLHPGGTPLAAGERGVERRGVAIFQIVGTQQNRLAFSPLLDLCFISGPVCGHQIVQGDMRKGVGRPGIINGQIVVPALILPGVLVNAVGRYVAACQIHFAVAKFHVLPDDLLGGAQGHTPRQAGDVIARLHRSISSSLRTKSSLSAVRFG